MRPNLTQISEQVSEFQNLINRQDIRSQTTFLHSFLSNLTGNILQVADIAPGEVAPLADLSAKILSSLLVQPPSEALLSLKRATLALILRLPAAPDPPFLATNVAACRPVLDLLRAVAETAQRERLEDDLSALLAVKKILGLIVPPASCFSGAGNYGSYGDLSDKYPGITRFFLYLKAVLTNHGRNLVATNLMGNVPVGTLGGSISLASLEGPIPGLNLPGTPTATIRGASSGVLVAAELLSSLYILFPSALDPTLSDLLTGDGLFALFTPDVPLDVQTQLVVFLATVARSSRLGLRSYDAVIARTAVKVLKAAGPVPDGPMGGVGAISIATREVLLHAVRQLLTSEMGHSLLTYVDELLDESVLLGVGVGAGTGGTKFAAVSLVSELYGLGREKLNVEKARKFVIFFVKVVAEGTANEPAVLALRTLGSMVDKKNPNVGVLFSKSTGSDPDVVVLCLRVALAALTSRPEVAGASTASSLLKAALSLLRAVVSLYAAKLMRTSMAEMLQVLDASFERVVEVIQEERELLDGFSSVLCSLPEAVFGDLLTAKMEYLINATVKNSNVQFIPLFLIQQPTVGLWFIELFLAWCSGDRLRAVLDNSFPSYKSVPCSINGGRQGTSLIDQIIHICFEKSELADWPRVVSVGDSIEDGSNHRDVIIRIYRMAFKVLQASTNPGVVETILRPFMSDLLTTCLRTAQVAENLSEASSALSLVKYLFRCVTPGGKCVQLYAQFAQSMLEEFLDVTAQLGRHFRKVPELHCIITEIQLMVPCRIRQLLGVLPRLRGPVVDAIESGSSELTTLALCTLELWTENVALSSLQNAVVDKVVIKALLTLIHVPQGFVAHTTSSQGFAVRAVKILGKLGVGFCLEVLGPEARSEKIVSALQSGASLRVGSPVVVTASPTATLRAWAASEDSSAAAATVALQAIEHSSETLAFIAVQKRSHELGHRAEWLLRKRLESVADRPSAVAIVENVLEADTKVFDGFCDLASTVWGSGNLVIVFEDTVRKVLSGGTTMKTVELLRRVVSVSVAPRQSDFGIWVLAKALDFGNAQLANLAFSYLMGLPKTGPEAEGAMAELYVAFLESDSNLIAFAAMAILKTIAGASVAQVVAKLDAKWTRLTAASRTHALRAAWLAVFLDIPRNGDIKEIVNDAINLIDSVLNTGPTVSSTPSSAVSLSVLTESPLILRRMSCYLARVAGGERGVQTLMQVVLKDSPEYSSSAFAELVTAGSLQGLGVAYWESGLLNSVGELLTRSSFSIAEARACGRILRLIGKGVGNKLDQQKKSIGERLNERLQVVLGGVKTFFSGDNSGMSQSPGHQLQWRTLKATSENDNLNLVTAIFECLGELVSDSLSFPETVLAVALTVNSGLNSYLASPVAEGLAYYIARDPLRSVEHIQVRTDLGKYLPVVAPVLSLPFSTGSLSDLFIDRSYFVCLVDSTVFSYRVIHWAALMTQYDPGFLLRQHRHVPVSNGNRSGSVLEALLRILETCTGPLWSGAGSLGNLGQGGLMSTGEDQLQALGGVEARMLADIVFAMLRTAGELTGELSQLRLRLVLRLVSLYAVKLPVEMGRRFFTEEFRGIVLSRWGITERRDLVLKIADTFADGKVAPLMKVQLIELLLLPVVSDIFSETELVVKQRVIGMLLLPRTEEALRILVLNVFGKLRQSLAPSEGKIVTELVKFVNMQLSNATSPSLREVLLVTSIKLDMPFTPLVDQVFRDPSYSVPIEEIVELLSTKPGGLETLLEHLIAPRILEFEFDLSWARLICALKRRLGADISRALVSRWAWFLNNLLASAPLGSSHATLFDVSECLLDLPATQSTAEVIGTFLVRQAFSDHNHFDRALKVFSRHQGSFPGSGVPLVTKILPGIQGATLPGATSGGQASPGPEIARHIRVQTVATRLLRVAVTAGVSADSLEALAVALGPAFVSTDRQLVQEAVNVVFAVCRRIPCPGRVHELQSKSWFEITGANVRTGSVVFYKYVIDAIVASLAVLGGNRSAGVLRVNCMALQGGPGSQGSHCYQVSSYLAGKLLEAVLCGLPDLEGLEWIQVTESLMLKAATAAVKDLVVSATPVSFQTGPIQGASSQISQSGVATIDHAYPGSLSSPEASVPGLLSVLRVLHLQIDVFSGGSAAAGAVRKEIEQIVLSLITSLAPLVVFAPEPQTTTFQVAQSVCGVPLPETVNRVRPGGSTASGSLPPVFTAQYLSALLRFCVGMVGRWVAGNSFSLGDGLFDEPRNSDHQVSAETGNGCSEAFAEFIQTLNLSFPRAFCDFDGVQCPNGLTNQVPAVHLCNMVLSVFRACDGVAHFSGTLGEAILRQMFGFIPSYGLIGPPCSCLSAEGGMHSLASMGEGLFGCAAQVALEAVLRFAGILDAQSAILGMAMVGATAGDSAIRDAFLQSGVFQAVLVGASRADRLKLVLEGMPWEVVGDRNVLGLMGSLMEIAGLAPGGGSFGESASVEFSLCEVFSEKLDTVQDCLQQFVASSAMRRQGLFKPNIIELIFKTYPGDFDTEVLLYGAMTFGLWREVQAILECRSDYDTSTASALAFVYRNLRKLDSELVMCGVAPDLVARLQHGHFEAVLKTVNAQQPQSGHLLAWKTSTEQLAQWASIHCENWGGFEEKAEVAIKTQGFAQLREVLEKTDVNKNGKLKVFAAFSALNSFFMDRSILVGSGGSLGNSSNPTEARVKAFLSDLDSAVNRVAFTLIQEYLATGNVVEALLRFQELTEASEASNYLGELRRHAQMGMPGFRADGKQTLNLWRERTPGKHVLGIREHHELLFWRNMTFTRVHEILAAESDAQVISPYAQDMPWVLEHFSNLLLSRGQRETAQAVLGRFALLKDRSHEAFGSESCGVLKLQAKILFTAACADWTPTSLQEALELLQNAPRARWTSRELSELEVLRSRVLKQSSKNEEARKSSELAAKLSPENYKAWVLLSELAEEDENEEDVARSLVFAIILEPRKSFKILPKLLRLANEGGLLEAEDICVRIQTGQMDAKSALEPFANICVAGLADNGPGQRFFQSIVLGLAQEDPQRTFWTLVGPMTSVGNHELVSAVFPKESEMWKLRALFRGDLLAGEVRSFWRAAQSQSKTVNLAESSAKTLFQFRFTGLDKGTIPLPLVEDTRVVVAISPEVVIDPATRSCVWTLFDKSGSAVKYRVRPRSETDRWGVLAHDVNKFLDACFKRHHGAVSRGITASKPAIIQLDEELILELADFEDQIQTVGSFVGCSFLQLLMDEEYKLEFSAYLDLMTLKAELPATIRAAAEAVFRYQESFACLLNAALVFSGHHEPADIVNTATHRLAWLCGDVNDLNGPAESIVKLSIS